MSQQTDKIKTLSNANEEETEIDRVCEENSVNT